MVDLVFRPAVAVRLPVSEGGCTLAQMPEGALSWISPLPGRRAVLDEALERRHGLSFPAPGQCLVSADGAVRILWHGPDEALLLGGNCAGIEGARCVDQAHAFARLRLSGAAAVPVLARLVPLDLRRAAFGPQSCARSLLGQVPLLIWRVDDAAFGLLVPRSMAGFAVAGIRRAMGLVGARGDG